MPWNYKIVIISDFYKSQVLGKNQQKLKTQVDEISERGPFKIMWKIRVF